MAGPHTSPTSRWHSKSSPGMEPSRAQIPRPSPNNMAQNNPRRDKASRQNMEWSQCTSQKSSQMAKLCEGPMFPRGMKGNYIYILIFSTRFNKSLKSDITKILQWKQSCYMQTDTHDEDNKSSSRVTQKRLTRKYASSRILETAEPSFGLVDGKSADTSTILKFLIAFLTQP
jgi:hypothetical protein